MKRRTYQMLVLAILLGLSACAAPAGSMSKGEGQAETQQAAREADPSRLGEELPAAEAFEGGKGTEEEPYEIASPEQLALLARKVNEGDPDYRSAHYRLTEDISLNDTADLASWDRNAPQHQWTAIGDGRSGNAEFAGVFDGGGHRISGMYCYGADTVSSREEGNFYLGLFGVLRGAVVKDVVLADSCLS